MIDISCKVKFEHQKPSFSAALNIILTDSGMPDLGADLLKGTAVPSEILKVNKLVDNPILIDSVVNSLNSIDRL